VVERYW